MGSVLDHALRYAKLGWSVVPAHSVREDGRCSCGRSGCSSPGKHPRGRWEGRTHSALPERELRSLWNRYPDSNIGVVTGRISDLVVIDIDGEEGIQAIHDAGLAHLFELETPKARTGGGGYHIYVRYPEGVDHFANRVGVLNHVDIRADGGFVIAPPSMHTSGNSYEWEEGSSPEEVDPGMADLGWAEGKSTKKSKKKDADEDVEEEWFLSDLQGASEGSRNDTTTRLAGRYIAKGCSEEEVLLLLSCWNEMRNVPALPHQELETIVSSVARREFGERDLENLHEKISDAIHLKFRRIRQITGTEPRFILTFGEGVTGELTISHLLSPVRFREAVAAATGVIPRKLGNKTNPTYDRFAQWLLDAVEIVDAGVEATTGGETMIMVSDYIGNQSLSTVGEEDPVPDRGVFVQRGRVWFSLRDLMQYISAQWGVKLAQPQLAQRLRAVDVERHVFHTENGTDRPMWGVDTEFVGRRGNG